MIEFREPRRTGFELRWRMFGILYRVLPSFFLFAALFAYVFIRPFFPNARTLALGILVDVGCIFLTIVFTEFIQGLVYRSYGLRSTVLIQEFGGGIYPEAEPPFRIQRIAAALASPASAFILLALVYYSNLQYQWSETSAYALFAYVILRVITIFWGIMGLLPMFPYPGGRIMMEVLTFFSPRYGLQLTLVVSILIGLAFIADVALYFLHGESYIPYVRDLHPYTRIFLAIIFALVVSRNWQILQIIRAQQKAYDTRSDEYDDREPWER